ncbi:MAG TPA: TIGR03009 domain-containing protein [Gemmataceae bacterium]|nr:TIGR03009 domain-containing protein [Gemmataceae bacterium]
MRNSCLALSGALLLGTALYAQQPPPAPAPAAPLNPNDRLDALLMQWEAKMKSVQTLKAMVNRTRVDKVFNTQDTYVGEVKYMKPNLALLDLRRRDRQDIFEKYICTGTYLYEYNQSNREIRYQELPPPKPGQVTDDNLFSFVLGMKAEEAKRRYNLRLVADGKDPNYHYVEILPRFPADRADFEKAQLVLTQSTMMPRRLSFFEPNGNQITWDIPVIEINIQLDRREFTSPTLPSKDWKLVKAPKAAPAPAPSNNDLPPRVVRPKP